MAGAKGGSTPGAGLPDSLVDSQLTSRGWAKLRCLGTGAYGAVLLARCTAPASSPKAAAAGAAGDVGVMAVKVAYGSKQVAAARTEVEVMRALDHPCVLRCFESWEAHGGDFLAFVLQYVPGRDLHAWTRRTARLCELDAVAVTADLLSALTYLAELPDPVVHRDVKPHNLLLHTGPSKLLGSTCRAVLADFGLACRVSDTEPLRQRMGSVGYASPEACSGVALSAKSDVFAAGCVFHFALSGAHLFGSGDEAWNRNCKCKYVIAPDVTTRMSCLVRWMAAPSSRGRPTAREAVRGIVQHEPDGPDGWLQPPAAERCEAAGQTTPALPTLPSAGSELSTASTAAPPAGARALRPVSLGAAPGEVPASRSRILSQAAVSKVFSRLPTIAGRKCKDGVARSLI